MVALARAYTYTITGRLQRGTFNIAFEIGEEGIGTGLSVSRRLLNSRNRAPGLFTADRAASKSAVFTPVTLFSPEVINYALKMEKLFTLKISCRVKLSLTWKSYNNSLMCAIQSISRLSLRLYHFASL